MSNRLTSNPIYFDQFNAVSILAEKGQHFIVKKIRIVAVADGDLFLLEDLAGKVLYRSVHLGAADVEGDDFGDDGFDFGANGNGVQINYANCTGMAATDGTDAVWFYMK